MRQVAFLTSIAAQLIIVIIGLGVAQPGETAAVVGPFPGFSGPVIRGAPEIQQVDLRPGQCRTIPGSGYVNVVQGIREACHQEVCAPKCKGTFCAGGGPRTVCTPIQATIPNPHPIRRIPLDGHTVPGTSGGTTNR
jgi:hypothetical protein